MVLFGQQALIKQGEILLPYGRIFMIQLVMLAFEKIQAAVHCL